MNLLKDLLALLEVKAMEKSNDPIIRVAITYSGNTYILSTNGKFVELHGKSSHSLSSIMFGTNVNGTAAKEKAVRETVLKSYKDSKADAKKLISALITLTKLPSSYFKVEDDGKTQDL